MKKEIKKLAQSHVIILTPEELKLYGLTRGDIVDLELVKQKQSTGGENPPRPALES